MNWILKSFDQLTSRELYAILQLRNEVFVVEQNCVFQDADGKDGYCHHLMAWEPGYLAAYTRLVPPDLAYPGFASIGRVVSSPKSRGTGLGKELMERSIGETKNLFPGFPIRIGAQLYLKKFYTELGFQQTDAIYLEDGIEHIEMTLSETPK